MVGNPKTLKVHLENLIPSRFLDDAITHRGVLDRLKSIAGNLTPAHQPYLLGFESAINNGFARRSRIFET